MEEKYVLKEKKIKMKNKMSGFLRKHEGFLFMFIIALQVFMYFLTGDNYIIVFDFKKIIIVSIVFSGMSTFFFL